MNTLKKNIIVLSSILLSTNLYAQVIPDGTYFLQSEHSGDCVELSSTAENIKAVQNTCLEVESQKFVFTHITDDNYTISNFAIGQNSQSNGAHIYNSTQSAEFKIESSGSQYKIKSSHSSKYLTAKPFTREVIQYRKHNSDAQLWNISEELPGTLVDTEIVFNGKTYDQITSSQTQRVWLDRNLGADQVCTSFDDSACFGDYYQWGRLADGHENVSSSTTSTLASTIEPSLANFILNTNSPTDDWTSPNVDNDGNLRISNWNKPDESSICPIGYRVPTEYELTAETINNGVNNKDSAFSSFLKLPASGHRYYNDASLRSVNEVGNLWSSSTNDNNARGLGWTSYNATWYNDRRTYAFNVRCIKN